mgnify:CR=1 FL=1
MKRFQLTLMALLLSVCLFAQDLQRVTSISYRPNDKALREQCVLDIIKPQNAKDMPVVVWFHGGGLTMADRNYMPKNVLDTNYIVVTVDYRLLKGDNTLDNCIDDAAASVAWVFDNISKYGGDPSKIVLSGHSAGAYLSNMIGLDKKWLAKYGKDPDKLLALIPFSGQVISHFAYRKQLGMSALQPSIDIYAPLYYVRPDAPPIVIITADREKELYGRYEEDAYFYRMLKLVGHPNVWLYELGGYTHVNMDEPACQILKDHLNKLLGKPDAYDIQQMYVKQM